MNLDDNCVEVTVHTSPEIPKKEESLQNNDNDASSSPRASSPEANCPICLGMPENKSFTDSCLHQFCFKCLLEWSKVKAECPLCKQSFKSIIHNVRSIEDYEQYYLSTTSTEGTLYVSQEIFARLETTPPTNYREPSNYRFRTTAVSSYLDYFVRLEGAISHHVIPPGPSFSGGTLWQRRRQRGTSDFRRNIYQQGLWVQRTTDISGRVRECSPEFYRGNPAQVHRLVPWLNRELNVLLHENSPHIQHVMSRILELITQVPIRGPGFAAVIAPYIGRHTEHFIHEFHSFAISPFDLVGYDRHANYVGRSEIVHHEETSLDSDSDVQVLEEGLNVVSPLIQLVDTDSDDCIVLDTPMRAEPEVITLDSDDDEVVQINIQTYQPQQSTSALISQPKPSTSRRPRLKRNWLKVNNVQVPNTSLTSENVDISISIAHSSRSVSPSGSEISTVSWVPIRKKPTKVKKKKETSRKRKSHKSKSSKSKAKVEVVTESEDEGSPGPVFRQHKPSIPIMSPSYSEGSDSDRTRNADRFDEKPSTSAPREESLMEEDTSMPALPGCPLDSNSERLFIATNSSSSSDESKYKPRLRSVVVKSTVKPELRVVSPTFLTSPSRLESYDYNFVPYDSFRSYLDIPSSSRSRSDSYRSIYSHQSRHSSSSSEIPRRKRCKKHYKKRSKRDKS